MKLTKALTTCLAFAVFGSCGDANLEKCRMNNSGWAVGSFYPPRPDGPGRLDKPILFEVTLAGSQTETGGRNNSEVKLLKLRLLKLENGETVNDRVLEDCIVLNVKDFRLETEWDTSGQEASMDVVPTRMTLDFIDGTTGSVAKSVSYNIPQE